MKKIVILSGAGMSAESGLKTFRDSNGLWEGYDVMEVASIDGWQRNPELVLEFYNQRRKQLLSVEPNQGHHALVELAKHYHLTVVTQNVDDLHERAGNDQVIHLHGELLKACSCNNKEDVIDWRGDIRLGDTCSNGHQLRPFIVWFGELVPMLGRAADCVSEADIVIIVGTSMQVYPAASLISYAKPSAELYYLDANPATSAELVHLTNLDIRKTTAAIGLPMLVKELIKGKRLTNNY